MSETSIKCDICEKVIGNTLYEVGQRRLCPVCWLGDEGKEPKYQQFDASWTETNLKAFKDKPWKDDIKDARNWTFSMKDAKWTRKEVVPDGDPL